MLTSERTKTYLADLSAEATDRVLRSFSEKPENRTWNRYFPADALIELAHLEHPLRKSMLSNVTEVSLKPSTSRSLPVCAETVTKVLEVYGAHLSALSLPCLSYFAPQCNDDHWDANAQRRRIYTTSVSECLIQYVPGLKRLDVTIDLKLGSRLTRTLEGLGPTLNSLTLNIFPEVHSVERFDVGTLIDLCPHIVELNIPPVYATDRLRDELEGLHCSYGEKLRRCKVFGERTEYLRKLLTSCPNAVFDVHVSSGTLETLLKVLNIVGQAIRSFSCSPFHDHMLNMEALSTASSKCINMESLEIFDKGGLRCFTAV